MKVLSILMVSFFSGLLFAQENGLYSSLGAKKGVEVLTVDSQHQQINLKKKIKILRAFVFSINNDNTDFFVELIIPQTSDKEWPVLVDNGKYYRARGKGSGGKVNSVSFLVDRAGAEEIALKLNVPCNLRKDFGHKLKFEFIPMKDDYKVGDSVYVKFKITNVGDISVWYNHGGSYRNTNGRCNYFDFEVYYSGLLLPDEGPEYDFGGLEAHPELKPGESDSLTECITKWSHFRKPGKYTIKCTYRMHLQSEWNMKDYPDNQEDLHKAWDQKAEKTIEIIIKE